jgi:hypothetical protein
MVMKKVKRVNMVDVLSIQECIRKLKPVEVTIRRGMK